MRGVLQVCPLSGWVHGTFVSYAPYSPSQKFLVGSRFHQRLRWALVHESSLQPVAAVGRTRDRMTPEMSLDTVWDRICLGVGRHLNRHALHFGHTACNIVVPVLVLSCGRERHVVEGVRDGHDWDLRIMSWAIRALGPAVELNDGASLNLLRCARVLLSRPHRLLELMAFGVYRFWTERSALFRLALLGRPRLHPLLLVVHKFMSRQELETPLGRERLQSCVFKLPVNGRMVSMCEVNATSIRRELNAERVSKLDDVEADTGATLPVV